MEKRSDSKSEKDNKDVPGLRTVIIEQGDSGYGLTVSGENPVNVECVKDGGPADVAGVKKGDSLICVNDRPVSKFNHKDVVMIIKSTHKVKLTLKSKDIESEASEHPPKPNLNSKSSSDLITAPLPVNNVLQSQFEGNKVKMLHVFLEKQRKVKENIMAELQKNPSKIMQQNLSRELDSVNRQITKITEELKDTDSQLLSHSRSFSRVPSSGVGPNGSHPHSFHPYSKHTRSASSSSHIEAPPIPARNRNLISQNSAPNIASAAAKATAPFQHSFSQPAGEVSSVASPLSAAAQCESPPPLPPRAPVPDRSDADTGQGPENLPKSTNIKHSSSSGSDSSGRHSHQRIRSSPDQMIVHGSPGSNRLSGGDFLTEWSSWGKLMSEDDPPPGTPPPPYGGNSGGSMLNSPHSDDIPPDDSFSSALSNDTGGAGIRDAWTNSIIMMEEEDGEPSVENHGPFQSLTKLLKSNAHLAVFVNYVISNCDDPSSLFFYMITDLYKEGGVKEMKKWAYEIHSSFLLPGSPMKLANVEESVLYEIDETLQTSLDKEEILRKVFWKARQRSREDLNKQLADFRGKRSAGLGSLFGPPDHKLNETIANKVAETCVVEELLVPILDSVSEDLKNLSEKMLVMASSLATLLWKYFGLKSQQSLQLIDRCPLFVNKDRPLRSKILKGSKKQQVVREHHFTLTTFYSVSFCNHCHNVIWGVSPQGYQCSDCEMNVHKWCTRLVEETCVGQVHRNERLRDSSKLSALLNKIIPEERERNRKGSSVSVGDRPRRGFEEGDIFGHLIENEAILGEKLNKEQRRSDPGAVPSGAGPAPNNSGSGCVGVPDEAAAADDADNESSTLNNSLENTSNNISRSFNPQRKKSSASINRSESCKEKQNYRKQLRENRKNSDPNIPTTKSSDVDGENLNFHSESSSSSSLSQSQETSSINVIEQIAAYASALDNDSDVEADADLPDWTARVPQDTLYSLSSKERKRQDTINELFHTEQSHVRTLKVLQFLFHYPLRQGGYISADLLDSLFPNMDQILRFHTSFNKAMKKRRQEPLVSCVGDILTNMFVGDEGAQFQAAAAEFVACQGFALDSLKQQQKRDQKLAIFLQDQENHPHCRRLQLKDMLPSAFQRLSKYPLLLESLLSYTDRAKHGDEHEQIGRALDRSREMLVRVNEAVHDAENHKRLADIQRKLDQTALLKNKHGNLDDLKGELNLTKHRLIYEGPLTWKVARGQKNIDLHVLILEDCVVLLQKDNDKYVLKYHSMNKSLGKDENKPNLSPIIRFGNFFCREVATDKCGIFIILTQASFNPHIYELVASSPMERSMWLRHLHEAQANFNAKEGRHRRSQPSSVLLQESDETGSPTNHLPEIDDSLDGEASETGETVRGVRSKQDHSERSPTPIDAHDSSPESISKKTELLRRKDQRIRDELASKQALIADILSIPLGELETVADVAGEAGLANREPRDLVLAALVQAQRLQESLNDAQALSETALVVAAAGHTPPERTLAAPVHTMHKLLTISASLNHYLNSLMILVSDREEERDRMRKELVVCRDRLHQMHRNSANNAASTDTPAAHRPCSPQNSSTVHHSSQNPDIPFLFTAENDCITLPSYKLPSETPLKIEETREPSEGAFESSAAYHSEADSERVGVQSDPVKGGRALGVSEVEGSKGGLVTS